MSRLKEMFDRQIDMEKEKWKYDKWQKSQGNNDKKTKKKRGDKLEINKEKGNEMTNQGRVTSGNRRNWARNLKTAAASGDKEIRN